MLFILETIMSSLLGTVFRKIFPNKTPDEINLLIKQVEPEIAAAIQAGVEKAQAAVTEKEASSIYKFVSYARAALLWVCIGVFVYSQVITPLIYYGCGFFGVACPELPEFNNSSIIGLLYSLLGVSTVHHVIPKN